MIFDEKWGPVTTIGAIFSSLFVLSFPLNVWVWSHVGWLIENDKEIADWLAKYVRTTPKFDDGYSAQTGKRIAWGIMLIWEWFVLFVITPPYEPIIGRFRLLNITTFLFNFFVFLIGIILFKWLSEKR